MANRVVRIAIDEAGLSHNDANAFLGKDGTLKAPPHVSEVLSVSAVTDVAQVAEPVTVQPPVPVPQPVQIVVPPPEKKRGGRPRKNAVITETTSTESV